jgi:hypothetical protein
MNLAAKGSNAQMLLLSLMGMQQEVEEGERRKLSICVRRLQPVCGLGAARGGATRYARGT